MYWFPYFRLKKKATAPSIHASKMEPIRGFSNISHFLFISHVKREANRQKTGWKLVILLWQINRINWINFSVRLYAGGKAIHDPVAFYHFTINYPVRRLSHQFVFCQTSPSGNSSTYFFCQTSPSINQFLFLFFPFINPTTFYSPWELFFRTFCYVF